ncbi:hypothetical protein NONO_c12310 [Nocardia nova SH22a]|uniref:Resolvase/invertase-type recombinase catalytic domain-containing protein n=1 Tax=Nocardia nova SH22a TaxID=1415166 RepID=W5TAM3_9NOCA|nr:hypothetical protein [Nocardia nova]AHH16038.1 hypothetical protein NONO_c12310 [Nocardia nova SH22a]
MSIEAIGYIRSDISRRNQRSDEEQLRNLAKRSGYDLRKTIVFGSRTDDPEHRLAVVLSHLPTVEVVLVPSMAHFHGGTVPTAVGAHAKVVAATTQSVLEVLFSTVVAGR